MKDMRMSWKKFIRFKTTFLTCGLDIYRKISKSLLFGTLIRYIKYEGRRENLRDGKKENKA
jgi:hypothetical protein